VVRDVPVNGLSSFLLIVLCEVD